jgi:hypothetical protein
MDRRLLLTAPRVICDNPVRVFPVVVSLADEEEVS